MKGRVFATLLLILAVCASALGADGDRTIQADLKESNGPGSMVWQDCAGVGGVGKGLRAGWRQKLQECEKHIGFNYIRVHGLPSDELGLYSEDTARDSPATKRSSPSRSSRGKSRPSW